MYELLKILIVETMHKRRIVVNPFQHYGIKMSENSSDGHRGDKNISRFHFTELNFPLFHHDFIGFVQLTIFCKLLYSFSIRLSLDLIRQSL